MASDAPFDPCRQWLGIDAVDLGNARLVLGVTPQEADPLTVLRAAEARLNLLRSLSPGPLEMARAGLIKRVEESREKLLAEIAAGPPRIVPVAGTTFTMPRPPSQLAAASPPSLPAAGFPIPPSTGPPAAVPASGWPHPDGEPQSGGYGQDQFKIRKTVYRKQNSVAGTAALVLSLAAVAGGLWYYSIQQKKLRAVAAADRLSAARASKELKKVSPMPDRKPKEEKKKLSPDPTSDDAISSGKPATPRDRPRPVPAPAADEQVGELSTDFPAPAPAQPSRPKPMKPAAKPANDEVMDDPSPPEPPITMTAAALEALEKESRELGEKLEEVLEAMQKREYDTASRLLAKEAKKAASPQAGRRLAGWEYLAEYSKGFDGFRDQALAAVQAGDEYDVKNQKVAIVEVDTQVLKYRASGKTTTVRLDKIPGGIVLAIVMQWFDENPANDLYLGAYHLSKPEPDPSRAREHWEKADAAGADASALLPLLDDPVFAKAE